MSIFPTPSKPISWAISLEPGDMISTGTPGGIGIARNPSADVKHGDSVAVHIDGTGKLTNLAADGG